jgi:hypothetical protein
MREHNVSSGSKNPHSLPESESSLAAVIAVVSFIVLLALCI